jgi:hypothetical protein
MTKAKTQESKSTLPDLAKKYKECTKSPDSDCEGCPLMGYVNLQMGDLHDTDGQVNWKIQACSLMAILDEFIEGKKEL